MNQSMDRNKINAQNNGIDHNIYGVDSSLFLKGNEESKIQGEVSSCFSEKELKSKYTESVLQKYHQSNCRLNDCDDEPLIDGSSIISNNQNSSQKHPIYKKSLKNIK